MTAPLSFDAFSEMLGYLYEGPLETPPWQSFIRNLQSHVDCNYVTIILRPQSSQLDGLMVNTSGTDEVVASYNEYYAAMDPFVGLPNLKVVTLDELIPREDLMNSTFYKNFLSTFDVAQLIGCDINTPEGAQCRIRICRSDNAPRFTQRDKDLLGVFIPHFERALRLHMQLNRIESERNLYSGTVDQMAVGTIILDQDGKVMQTNRVADQLLQEKDGIKLTSDGLHVGSTREGQEFRRLIKQALSSQKGNNPSVAEALRVQRPSGRADLGVLVRSVPLSEWNQGKQCPSVAIFINDPEQVSRAPHESIKALFGLTPAETQLALLLANGLTLDEAAEELVISRNTVRAHLRSIFSKTGVTRQTMLVRLILRSVATLG